MSSVERAAAKPIKIHTINKKTCAPDASGELNISSNIIKWLFDFIFAR